MKKLLFLHILLISSMSLTVSIETLKEKRSDLKEKIKEYKSEIKLYRKSVPIMRTAKAKITQSRTLVSKKKNRLESLTGIVVRNGITRYNNNPSSNHVLENENTKLQNDINELTSANNLIDESIVAARLTLGELRTKTCRLQEPCSLQLGIAKKRAVLQKLSRFREVSLLVTLNAPSGLFWQLLRFLMIC